MQLQLSKFLEYIVSHKIFKNIKPSFGSQPNRGFSYSYLEEK